MQPQQAVQPGIDSEISVSIRPARIEDAEALAALSGQLGYPSSRAAVERRLVPLLSQSAHVILLAEANGASPGTQPHVVGWIHGFVKHTIEADPMVELGGLVVDEAWRGHGVGRLLIEAVERWTRSVGCSAVTVRCNAMRERAHAFYQNLGYGAVKTQRVFRKSIAP